VKESVRKLDTSHDVDAETLTNAVAFLAAKQDQLSPDHVDPDRNMLIDGIAIKDAYDLACNAVKAVKMRDIAGVQTLIDHLLADLDYWFPRYSASAQSYSDWDLFLFKLSSWLDGLTPPPRCEYIMQKNQDNIRCEFESDHCSNFCMLHRCKFISAESSERCISSRSPSSDYCIGHACAHELCANLKFGSFAYCIDHICPGCTTPSTRHPIRRFACELHECQYVIDSKNFLRCDNLVVSSKRFCSSHLCVACVNLNVDDPLPRAPSDGLFCLEHKCKIPACKEYIYCPSNNDDIESEYCFQHSCKLCIALEKRDILSGYDAHSHFCSDHRCANPDSLCKEKRLANSLFCIAHSCRVCRDLGAEIVDPVVDEVPRNACANHPLCNYVSAKTGGLCNSPTIDGSFYCSKHSSIKEAAPKAEEAEKKAQVFADHCAGITTKKKPCKAKSPFGTTRSYYCSAHAFQAPIGAEDADENASEESDKDEANDNADDGDDLLKERIPPPKYPMRETMIVNCCFEASRDYQCYAQCLVARHDPNQLQWQCSLHQSLSKELLCRVAKPTNEDPIQSKKSLDPIIPAGLPSNESYAEAHSERTLSAPQTNPSIGQLMTQAMAQPLSKPAEKSTSQVDLKAVQADDVDEDGK
jgi:hypothetical protein